MGMKISIQWFKRDFKKLSNFNEVYFKIEHENYPYCKNNNFTMGYCNLYKPSITIEYNIFHELLNDILIMVSVKVTC